MKKFSDEKRLLKRFFEISTIQGVTREENEIISYLKNFLYQRGFDFQEDLAGKSFGGKSGNLICRIQSSASRKNQQNTPPFLLSAHVDTIAPSSLSPELRDGRIVSGDGRILGADDRVGVLVLMEILDAISEGRINYPDLDVIFFVGEELGCLGSRYLDYSLLRAKYGFNFDCSAPPGSIVIQASKTIIFEVLFLGHEAHSAVHSEKGISAIFMAAQAISKLSSITRNKDLVFNIGMIEGGTKVNVIPGKVKITGEIRSFKDDLIQKQLDMLKNTIRETVKLFRGNFELNYQTRYKSFQISQKALPFQIAKQAIEQAGLEFKQIKFMAGSDANNLNAAGIQTVNIGLGYRFNHSPEEYIELQDLKQDVMIGIGIVEEASVRSESIRHYEV